MTKIPKQQTTWSALDFLENNEQETNALKSELERRAELRRKLAAELAKKLSSITTANDKLDLEIEARREKARKEVLNRTNYELDQQRILSQNRPLMSGLLSGTQDFIGYMLPGYSTLMFADDASKHSLLVGSAIKNRQWGAAAGNAIKVPADIAMGAVSLIPFTGGISKMLDKLPSLKNFKNPKVNWQNQLNEGVAEGFVELGKSSNPNNISFFTHAQGDDAVKMFKEYGGEAWPEGSSLGEQLLKYVPEARVRYGLQGNSNITDKEIAEALYKQIKSLPGLSLDGTEPILGFRGDTKRYTQLQPRPTPEEMITMGGTMDNSLGTLFLREYPHLYQQGVDRYLVTASPELSSMNPENMAINVTGSGTGAAPINVPKEIAISDYSQNFPNFYEYPIGPVVSRPGRALGWTFKIKPEYTSTGVNDLNAFMFRGKARNATNEILVANAGRAAGQLNNFNLHVKNKPVKDIADPEGLTYYWNGREISVLLDNSVEEGALRELMGEHYSNLLKEALQNGEGLLVSGRVNPTAKGSHPFRSEHGRYTYLALPNYNIRGAKHILPYDLRIPRDWSNPNIYKALSPVIGGTTLYFSNSKKQGGKLNYLNYIN